MIRLHPWGPRSQGPEPARSAARTRPRTSLELLIRDGAQVSYTDPYVPMLSLGGRTLESVNFEKAVSDGYDCAVVATNHRVFDYARIAAMPLVVDTRNALQGHAGRTIFRL